LIFVKSKNRDEFMNYIVRVRFSARFSGDVITLFSLKANKIVMLDQIYNPKFAGERSIVIFLWNLSLAVRFRRFGF
jgi:hypothetical protein